MRKIILTLLILSSVAMASSIHWAKDFKSGIAEATAKTKPVLFISSRHTCKYCRLLERTALSDPKNINELNSNFVTIISYSDEHDDMPRELWRPGTPAIWFLDEKGDPLFQPIMGAIDSENFYRALMLVKKEYIKRLKVEAKNRVISPRSETNSTK